MNILDPTQPFTYASGKTPTTYRCCECKKQGVKLWSEYIVIHTLLCADCSAREQRKDIAGMRPDGTFGEGAELTDQIGWRVPAVPKESNDHFWPYLEAGVPEEAIRWWQQLPLR